MITDVEVAVRTVARAVVCNDRGAGCTSTILRYDPFRPFEVEVVFDAYSAEPVPWVFARDVLAGYAFGIGDVRVRRLRGLVELALTSEEGCQTLVLPRPDVRRFLRLAYRLVPRGDESRYVDTDWALARLLDGGEAR